MPELLGRTNQAFPSIWFKPNLPAQPEEIRPLVSAMLDSGGPIDVSAQPALWGGAMRGTETTLLCRSSFDYSRATDETHATYLVQAHLIETLSCVGREHFDFYFLRVRDAVDEFQISGALQAMELARQEGHIRFLGLLCDGPALATLGQWQFHDAFEVVLLRRNPVYREAYDTLAPLARERRVGVVTEGAVEWGYGLSYAELLDRSEPEGLRTELIARSSVDHPLIVEVGSAREVQQAVEAVSNPDFAFEASLAPYVAAFESDQTWNAFADSQNPRRSAAFRRWRSE